MAQRQRRITGFAVRLCALALLASSFALPARAGAAAYTLWTGPAGAVVYAGPARTAQVLAVLPENQPIRVTTVSATWDRLLLWNALPAWALTSSLHAQPYTPLLPHWTPTVLHMVGPHAPLPLTAHGRLWEAAYLRAAPAFAAARRATLPRGATLTVDSWATDAHGAAWYHTTGAGGTGWVYGDAVTLNAGHPASPAALLAPLRGTGMWATYPLLEHSPAAAVVRAARAAGLTRLYVEVGRSNAGFYGAAGLAALLPLAHRAGLRVIAWVYPFLENLPSDVAMSVATARYVAPTGDRPDGLVADVETNMDEAAVRAYGQVLRAMLGPDRLMAIATYPPQSEPGAAYPFATAALSWNAIVPMDYWHLGRRAYTPGEAYRYVYDSVRLIRARAGASVPVEVLGQMFDPYESGVNNPSAAEIAACARAAHDAGALGVSYFEWNHATSEEWGALERDRW